MFFIILLISWFSILTGKYFEEIATDTGRYCFGIGDTMKALEMGMIDSDWSVS